MDALPWPAITAASGGWLLFAGVAWLVIRKLVSGDLVPRATLDNITHDRDEWRASHRISETARQVAADQVDELLEHARTTDSFIRSLPHPGGRLEP